MRYLQKTRHKNSRKRRLTRKKHRGGKSKRCTRDTSFDIFVISLWTRIQYELREINSKWMFDQHENKRFGSCNLWGWLRCHTSKEYDTHWDLYFKDDNRIELTLTYENEHNYRKANRSIDIYDMYNENDDEYITASSYFDELAEDLAYWIDNTYWHWVEEIDGWRRNDCN
jgi:hypothetical protein